LPENPSSLLIVQGITYATIAPLMLGFATIGLTLFYLAYRYNILFVTDTKIDTRGLIYPRALRQLFAGIYVAELCMIGLFAASVAIGPMVLMIVFLIFTVLFQITINSALDPLLFNLPRSLESEEESFRVAFAAVPGINTGHNGTDNVADNGASNGHNATSNAAEEKALATQSAPSQKKPNLVVKFLKPWLYNNYAEMRKLVPHNALDVDNLYSDEIARDAYFPPSVSDRTPLLWIPEDPAGISKQEIRDTSKVIPITDEGCILNDKNKLEWDTEAVRPPLWQEKIYY
jgi:hypothetical protein